MKLQSQFENQKSAIAWAWESADGLRLYLAEHLGAKRLKSHFAELARVFFKP
jgi:hypothetical protein